MALKHISNTKTKKQANMSTSSRITPIYIEHELDTTSSSTQDNNIDVEFNSMDDQKEAISIESWLPITESRNGNVWSCVFHLVSSGIGLQALFIPVAFAILGWAWAMTCFLLGFAWQLYTRWLLINLHESESGVRYSRFLQLGMVAFGPKLGKWLCMLPAMYLSSAQCSIIVITTGYNLKFLYELICLGNNSNCSKQLTSTQWFVIFACFAVFLLQHPNLNSLTWVSLLGTITAILFMSLLWITSLAKGRLEDITYDSTYKELSSKVARNLNTSLAMELISISFRGHNLILEIQGTLPSSSKHPPHKTMWKAVRIAYVLIGLCMFLVAVVGYWAYGNKITKEGILITFWKFHKDSTSTTILALLMILLIIQQLCSYQIYAMPSVDNFELKYVMKKNQPCPFWLRRVFRVVFVSINLFVAVSLPFLPALSAVTALFNISMTFVYPCFMWIAIKKPKVYEAMYWFNLVLGCLGILMCIVFVSVGIWSLSKDGLIANFFRP